MLKLKKTCLLKGLLLFLYVTTSYQLKGEGTTSSYYEQKANKNVHAQKSNKKRKQLKIKILLGCGLATTISLLFIFLFKKNNHTPPPPPVDPPLLDLIKDANKWVIMNETYIILNDKCFKFDQLQATELRYDMNFFENLGQKSEDVFLMNITHNNFTNGGTQDVLLDFIEKLTGKRAWGTMKPIKEKIGDEDSFSGLLADGVLSISTTNVGNKPAIQVIHIAEDKISNYKRKDSWTAVSTFDFVIMEAVRYVLNKNKHIVCTMPSFNTSNHVVNKLYDGCCRHLETMMLNAESDIIHKKNNREEIKSKNLVKKDIKKTVYLNLWHRNVIKNIPNQKLYKPKRFFPLNPDQAIKILAQYPGQIKIINKKYEDSDFFETIGLKDNQVILTDAANSTLTNGGGTTGGIWQLREKEYGGVKKRRVYNWNGRRLSKRDIHDTGYLKVPLKEGEVVISRTDNLYVAHLHGVSDNSSDSQNKNAEGIKKICQYVQSTNKAIVFCVFSGGIYASNDKQMERDMEANLLIAVSSMIKEMKSKNGNPVKIIFNFLNYHKKDLEKALGKNQIKS